MVASVSLNSSSEIISSPKPDRRSPMTWLSVFMLPSSSVRLIPKASMAVPTSLDGFDRFVSTVLSAVPPWLALIPLLAIRPRATAVSSAEKPRAPATGATYLKDSPSIDTLVLALLEAAAMTSASLPASPASIPKAVSASVTISDVVARSSPEDAARFSTPETPSIICCVSHPAMAM